MLFASFYAFVTFAFVLQLVPPLMRPIIREFDIGHADAGLLMSIVVIPGILLAVPAGVLVDRYGVRLTGSMSTTFIALGCFITAIADSFGTALVGRLILGVGGAFIVTAMPAIISQWFPLEELGVAMGIYGINMPLASVIAFPLASLLTLTFGWRYPFYIGTLMAVLNIVSFTLLIKEGPIKRGQEEGPSIQQALKSVETWKVGIVWLFFNAAALSFTTWSPKLFEDFMAINPIYASFLGSLLMWAAIPFVPIFGWVSDRIRRRRFMMAMGSALMAGALATIAFTSDAALIVSIVALGVAAALVPPMVMASPPEILGPALAGTGFGILAICLNIGLAIAPPTIGLLIDITRSPIIIFLGIALFSALGAVVALTLKINEN